MRYHANKVAVQLHTQLGMSGKLPCLIVLDNGKMADIQAMRKCFRFEPDNIYTYNENCDYAQFKEIDDKRVLFVT